MHKTILLPLLLCLLAQPVFAQSGQKMFDESFVHEIRLYFDDPGFWDTLTAHYYASLDFGGGGEVAQNVPLLARAVIDGKEVDSVAVKQKGFFSNWGAAESLRKPLKVDFNEFKNDGEYDDLKSLNLQNAFLDPSLMRDMLSYRILRNFGVAAPRSSFANVFLNDQLWGLYVVVESVNKTFLKEHFGDNDGNLYKAGFTSMIYLGDDQNAYFENFELKTNETINDWSRLIDFIQMINFTPDHSFKDSLAAHLDMESYLKSMAVDVSINNWDSHFGHGRNFYLYDNPADGKFHWIPWDYNLAFAGQTDYDIALENLRNMGDYNKILPKRVLNDEELKTEYLQIACQLHLDVFRSDLLDPVIDQTAALIAPDLENDPNKFFKDIEHFHQSLDEGLEFIQIDSFHLVDSVWNGWFWEIVDTILVFEHSEVFPGLKSTIATRNAQLQNELAQVYEITCTSPSEEPLSQPLQTMQLQAWPSPCTDWLRIKLPEPGGVFSLFDAQGRLITRGRPEASPFAISMNDYPSGIYWVHYESKTGSQTAKVVK